MIESWFMQGLDVLTIFLTLIVIVLGVDAGISHMLRRWDYL
jgi:hypothetical protein